MKCESCKGTGRIEMFLSVVDCLDCQLPPAPMQRVSVARGDAAITAMVPEFKVGDRVVTVAGVRGTFVGLKSEWTGKEYDRQAGVISCGATGGELGDGLWTCGLTMLVRGDSI